MNLPLFPLHTVLFPGGVLPLRIFEQRYVTMAKACLAEERSFGVCLITAGDEVMKSAKGAASPPQVARVGTLAKIVEWDMPQLGILHVRTSGAERFVIEDTSVASDGLVNGTVRMLPAEPQRTVAEAYAPLVRLLELIATRVGPQQFPSERHFDDATWIGYRLAEVLPLPLTIKQSMLEINDAELRLSVLKRFLAEQELI